ncbi:PGP1 isoform X1 [Iris pallida]|uniref:PGP1 isoform X1 n=1 Tax=Iris pallida TaxID=29817 RepID=A0AAX6HBG8_IRIPA|nr:PGP1 isoform X1 [Iris pallida]
MADFHLTCNPLDPSSSKDLTVIDLTTERPSTTTIHNNQQQQQQYYTTNSTTTNNSSGRREAFLSRAHLRLRQALLLRGPRGCAPHVCRQCRDPWMCSIILRTPWMCSLLILLRFFSDLVDSFESNADHPDIMSLQVVKYAFYFLVVGAGIWASSWAKISYCM